MTHFTGSVCLGVGNLNRCFCLSSNAQPVADLSLPLRLIIDRCIKTCNLSSADPSGLLVYRLRLLILNGNIVTNQDKWCPVSWRTESFRLPHGVHGQTERLIRLLSTFQVFVKRFHEEHSGLVINCPQRH